MLYNGSGAIRSSRHMRTAMTSKMIRQTTEAGRLEKFPDFPPRDDMQNSLHLDQPAYQASLQLHFGNDDSTIVLSEIPVRWPPGQTEGHRIPDLLVAFDVDRALAVRQMGFSVRHQGKPPDFVLEMASPTTGRRDYTGKRNDYAAFGIPEYWRFDPSGGRHHDASLAGDRLVEGVYQPIEVQETEPGHFRGHNDVLGLDLCWEDGRLRWWDPAAQGYLPTFAEEHESRLAAEGRADSEHEARTAAEARIRELEAELERRGETDNPGREAAHNRS